MQHLHSLLTNTYHSFHVLTIMNNDAMDRGLHVSIQISRVVVFFLDMYPGVRLLNHVLVLILVFYCFEEPSHGFL